MSKVFGISVVLTYLSLVLRVSSAGNYDRGYSFLSHEEDASELGWSADGSDSVYASDNESQNSYYHEDAWQDDQPSRAVDPVQMYTGARVPSMYRPPRIDEGWREDHYNLFNPNSGKLIHARNVPYGSHNLLPDPNHYSPRRFRARQLHRQKALRKRLITKEAFDKVEHNETMMMKAMKELSTYNDTGGIVSASADEMLCNSNLSPNEVFRRMRHGNVPYLQYDELTDTVDYIRPYAE